mmetsp:Transcript_38518/g.114377  ORF Transcript_38518/g.114377 Transcript_38518/m.114377 type:complete len:249 (+) Transcript_38518:210-956(+)
MRAQSSDDAVWITRPCMTTSWKGLTHGRRPGGRTDARSRHLTRCLTMSSVATLLSLTCRRHWRRWAMELKMPEAPSSAPLGSSWCLPCCDTSCAICRSAMEPSLAAISAAPPQSSVMTVKRPSKSPSPLPALRSRARTSGESSFSGVSFCDHRASTALSFFAGAAGRLARPAMCSMIFACRPAMVSSFSSPSSTGEASRGNLSMISCARSPAAYSVFTDGACTSRSPRAFGRWPPERTRPRRALIKAT